MKNPFKSTTIWSLIAMIAASAPGGMVDPLWGVLTNAGMPSNVVAGMQLAVFVAGMVGAIRGRMRADTPLGFRS